MCQSLHVRTYRNTLADWFSREEPKAVVEEMTSKGWSQVFPRERWEQLLERSEQPALALPEKANSVSRIAHQLAAQGKPLDPVSQVWPRGDWYVGTPMNPVADSTRIALAKFGMKPYRPCMEPSVGGSLSHKIHKSMSAREPRRCWHSQKHLVHSPKGARFCRETRPHMGAP